MLVTGGVLLSLSITEGGADCGDKGSHMCTLLSVSTAIEHSYTQSWVWVAGSGSVEGVGSWHGICVGGRQWVALMWVAVVWVAGRVWECGKGG